MSLPKENITRAIKRGTGEAEGMSFEEVTYEGYRAGGVAMICEVLTDNRNRTAAEIRKVFEPPGGKLGAVGSVAWMFDKKGLFMVSTAKPTEKLMELGLGPSPTTSSRTATALHHLRDLRLPHGLGGPGEGRHRGSRSRS